MFQYFFVHILNKVGEMKTLLGLLQVRLLPFSFFNFSL
jgi:hypothetical protein